VCEASSKLFNLTFFPLLRICLPPSPLYPIYSVSSPQFILGLSVSFSLSHYIQIFSSILQLIYNYTWQGLPSKLMFCYRIHRNPQYEPGLSQFNLAPNFTPYFSKVHFNFTLVSQSFTWPLFLRCFDQNVVFLIPPIHATWPAHLVVLNLITIPSVPFQFLSVLPKYSNVCELINLFMSTGRDYLSKLQPPTSLLFIPQMIYEYGEPRWNDTDRGNPNKSEKLLP
jgi:hypothetical protein